MAQVMPHQVSDTFLKLKQEFEKDLILPFYHVISDTPLPHVKNLYTHHTIASFKKDLYFLLEHYKPVDLKQLKAHVQNQVPLPKNAFFLSFDDGYRELYDIVVPILKELSIPATFFINKAFVDNHDLFYRNKASLLIDQFKHQDTTKIKALFEESGLPFLNFKQAILSVEYPQKHLLDLVAKEMDVDFKEFLKTKRPYLTSEEIKSMMMDGFTFGAHSIDHPKYFTIPMEEQIRQTKESMAFVVDRFNIQDRVFAFPFHDQGVSQQYFQTVFEDHMIEISFGTSGMIQDMYPNSIQRCMFEALDQTSAEEILVKFYNEKQSRLSQGKNVLHRPLSEVKTHTVSQLKKAIEQDSFWHQQNTIPITKYRAKAHVENPRASSTDLVLVTMHDQQNLIGYLGVLPDFIYINNKPVKWGWLTCWWSSQDYAGKGISQDLLQKIYDVYNGYIGCSEFTELGQRAAHKSGKLNALIIPGNIFAFEHDHLIQWREKSSTFNHVKIEYIQDLDIETESFILKNRKEELNRRSLVELSWMLRYPWVLSAPLKDITSSKLFFSSVSNIFRFYAVKVYDKKDNMIGFFILKLRDKKLTIPYLYYNPEYINLIAEVIIHHAAGLSAVEFKTYQQDLILAINNIGVPIANIGDHNKHCFFSKKINLDDVKNLHIQDGDGDNGFT